MKEIFYIYLIIGCYIAHRRTSNLDANSLEFLKTYLKIVFTYPKEFFTKKMTNKSEEGNQ
ncbi:hypothetical protein [Actinobacillus porcinus]|uniref:hypothetical protein n=1 Tax=Actinobacillus porcinus TaxID=51048 RepID=UPI002A9133E0|nr:hypothetical protein [Actinobacillus porcinus]MDY5420594.1 hypothetical protein [Actinobacillus porcinus]